MSNILIKAFSNLKTTQELNSYIEDLFELNKLPSWTVDIIPILQNWVTKIIEDGNVLCAISITKLLQRYICNMQASDIPEILNIYMKLNNLVDITTKWKIPDNLLKIAFWESVNELHMTLCSKFPASLNEFLITFGSVFLKSCIDAEVSFFLRQLRGKALNVILENSSHESRNEFRTANLQCIEKLLNALEKVGDYDFQTSLIEMVFRLTSSSERNHLVSDWFPNLRCVAQRLFIQIKDFDPDCRRFLNAFNAELGTKRMVFSYAAIKAKIGNFILRKPNISSYEHLWIDFNLGSGTVSILFDRSEPNVERSWETIIMYSHEVDNVELIQMHPQKLILELGRDPIDFFASPPSQDDCKLLDTKFTIEFENFIPDLEKLCHTLYGDKLKVLQKEPECLRRSKSNKKESMTIMSIREENGKRSDIYPNEPAAEENTERVETPEIQNTSLNNFESGKKLASNPVTSITVQSHQFNGKISNTSSGNETSEGVSDSFDNTNPPKKLTGNISCSSNIISLGNEHHKNEVSKTTYNICTPASGKRFAQNANLSSGTTSVFPFSPERCRESNAGNQLNMSKLKKIVNYKESPEKSGKKRKEGKSVTVISNDTETLVNQMMTKPEVIIKTNEFEIIDVTPEEEDEEIIPSSLTRMESICSVVNLTKRKHSSIDSDDVIPSSIVKTNDSSVVEITKPDVTSARKNLLKILDTPVSVNNEKNITKGSSSSNINETPTSPTKDKSNSTPEAREPTPLKNQNFEYKDCNDKTVNNDVFFCGEKETVSCSKDSEGVKGSDIDSGNGIQLSFSAQLLNTHNIGVRKNFEIIMETPESEPRNRFDNSEEHKDIDSAGEKSNNSILNENSTEQKGEGESIIMIQNLAEISFTEELVKDALDAQNDEYLTVCTSDFQVHYFSTESCSNNSYDSNKQQKCKLAGNEEIEIIERDENIFTKESDTVHHSVIERHADEERTESDNFQKQIESSEANKSSELTYVNSDTGKVNVILEERPIIITTDCKEVFEKMNKNVIIEVEEQENAVSSFKANQLDIQNSFDNLITVEPVKEVLDSVNNQESYLNSINTNDHTQFLTENTLNHNLHELASPSKAEVNEENLIDITNGYKKVKGKEVLNKENGLDDKSSLLTYLLSTPNKLDSSDNQKNSTELSTSPVSCKVVPSKLLSSTLNISEHLLRTPSAAERSCKTPLKSTARTNSRKKKGTSVLPDHYTPVASRIDMNKNPGSSCKSKKKLFSIETNNLLQDTPPECNQIIQVSKLVPPETTKLVHSETTVNNSEKEEKNSSESESTKDGSGVLRSQGYQIFKSKQRQTNSKDDHLFLTNEIKSRTLTVTANKSENQLRRKSLFSDFEFSDASDSDPWLHKKSTKKLSVKTYRGKPKKKRIYQGTSESDEFVVGREKRKAKSFPLRERKRHSSSDEDDLILFKSPKVAKISSRPSRTIVTRSMTHKTTTNKKETSTDKNTKRKYFVDLDSTISSPEVMRDTSLSQTASSFSEAQQISDINLTKPKNKKYKKFKKDISTCVKEINSSNESPIRSKEIDQYELVKEVLMDTLRPNLNTQNLISVQSLPPNPPNNTPVSEYLEDRNRSEIFNGIGSLSERKFGPQSTSSPKINYIGEPGSYINSSDGLDRDKHCRKSPSGLKVSKLNFENNENKSAEDIVYESPYRGDFMIPVHPNSDFSSSDELEPASHSELSKPEDRLKSNHNKKVMYIRKKTSTDGKPEEINEEIPLSPLAPQSLEELLKYSQNSDVIESVPFTSSTGFKTITENGAIRATNSLCSNSQENLVKKGDKENTERANLAPNAHEVEIMTGHFVYSETPRASVNQNMHQTPLKLCPKSLFEHEQCKRDSTLKQSECQPNLQEESCPDVMCSTSTQSRRDNEPGAQENSRLMSDTVRVPLGALNLLLEEVRTMGDLFKQNSRKCSVIYEVFKNMINRPMDAD